MTDPIIATTDGPIKILSINGVAELRVLRDEIAIDFQPNPPRFNRYACPPRRLLAVDVKKKLAAFFLQSDPCVRTTEYR